MVNMKRMNKKDLILITVYVVLIALLILFVMYIELFFPVPNLGF